MPFYHGGAAKLASEGTEENRFWQERPIGWKAIADDCNCKLKVNPTGKSKEIFYHSVRQLSDNFRKGCLTVLGMVISNGYPHSTPHADTDYDGLADYSFKKLFPKKDSVIYSQATKDLPRTNVKPSKIFSLYRN